MWQKIEVYQGDITQLAVDAIVNAANESLRGGGGVDGAIHRAAGPALQEACKAIGHCATGDACITAGFQLAAKHIIHTVGPVWQGGRQHEPRLLQSCYRRSFAVAHDHGVRTIAFPAISCGVYQYPAAAATGIAVSETLHALRSFPFLEKVIFACYSEEMAALYQETLKRLQVATA
jgi:O-acetyl-ADP-ribose deacetylase (regulator of RNase III)